MRGEGKEVFEKQKVCLRGLITRKDKGVFNLLYNTKNHLCFKSPIIHYPEQPSI